jgi:hypothetical protein
LEFHAFISFNMNQHCIVCSMPASNEYGLRASAASQWASVSSFTLFHTFHSLNLDF